MSLMPLKTNFALILIASSTLSGCSTTLGYVKDHPDPDYTADYKSVKEWAYDVADGYSSRGTINRYSLYWGGALIAGGTGALGGLAATGSTGHASIIIPLSAAFLGTMFGYYQNEQHAQLYFAASDSIKTLILKSEKRKELSAIPGKINELEKKSKAEKCNIETKITAYSEDIKTVHTNSKDLTNPSSDTISAIGKAIDEINLKITASKRKIDSLDTRLKNISLLKGIDKENITSYEAHCLTQDVNAIMRKVQVHLAQLDPKNVSEDLKKVGASESKGATTPPSPTGNGAANPTNGQSTGFDLSDLDPAKIVSLCEVEL